MRMAFASAVGLQVWDYAGACPMRLAAAYRLPQSRSKAPFGDVSHQLTAKSITIQRPHATLQFALSQRQPARQVNFSFPKSVAWPLQLVFDYE
jgi:hypothetical protein